jgi:hypothetical protein
MKKLQFLIIIIIVSLNLSQCSPFGNATNHVKPEVSLERMNHNITVRGAEVVRYFDKPVISGDSEAVSKINEHFDNEYEAWLNGNASKFSNYHDNRMSRFLDNVDISLERRKTEPSNGMFKYYVDASVTFLSEEVLSIRQTVYIASGSSPAVQPFGVTFDLATGELLPFTYFVDITADDFRSGLLDYVLANITIGYWDGDRVTKYLEPNGKHNFDYMRDEKLWDMSYDYYYEEDAIWLILRNLDTPIPILKWNGKSGEKFDGTLYFNYLGFDDIRIVENTKENLDRLREKASKEVTSYFDKHDIRFCYPPLTSSNPADILCIYDMHNCTSPYIGIAITQCAANAQRVARLVYADGKETGWRYCLFKSFAKTTVISACETCRFPWKAVTSWVLSGLTAPARPPR